MKITDIDIMPIQRLVGEKEILPELPAGPIGRLRLVHFLTSRFGTDFRMLKQGNESLNYFDGETKKIRSLIETSIKAKKYVGR